MGKGLGKGLGGVLKGIASGLIAFANPLVPLGAAAVGAAIVAIGAGIAGATWLVGQSLPSLKDGLKGFEELDGEALKFPLVKAWQQLQAAWQHLAQAQQLQD